MEDRKAAAAERDLRRLDGSSEIRAEHGHELVVLARSPSSFACRRPSGDSWPSSQPDATQRSLSVVVECVSNTISILDARLRRAMAQSVSWNQKKPTAPGPACVPTTAPSVDVNSISAFGPHAPCELGERSDPLLRVGVAIATRSPGPSVVASDEAPLDLGERLLLATHARDCDDLAALHAEHRAAG